VKVAWFTPLSTRSAIAEYSIHVVEALARRCSIDVWVGDDELHRQTAARTFEFHDERALLHRVPQYDLVVYNIGNSERFHGAIYEASKRHPGIVVLHDRTCHHLFASHWLEAGRPEEYFERLEALYGMEGRHRAEEAAEGKRPPIWESDEEALRFSLVEEVLVGALAVAVHSADHAADVRHRWFGPVGELFLPAYRAAPPPAPKNDNARTTLLTLGHVNRNKQVHRVLEILARDDELARRVDYMVVGPGLQEAYGKELVRRARQDGLKVSFLGYQPDEVVERVLGEADVCVNLRFPPFEGSSASLMRQLELGKPVLAFNVGGFRDVPDDAIVKVSPDDDTALERALRMLVEDDALRASVGRSAAAYAATLTPERYADAFLELTDAAASWAPVVRTVDAIADELTLMGAHGDLPTIGRVGHELGVLVDGMSDADGHAPLLRALGAGDREALERFLLRNDTPEITDHFHPFPMTSETADEIANRPGDDRYYGAFVNGGLVGLSMLRGWNEGFDVPSFGIVVDLAWHGRGIGSALTDFTLDRAPWLETERVRLSVYTSNQTAYRMYAARGFTELSREPVSRNGAADERIVMIKQIVSP
jgi:glycosyltransferase involved in cell wall biosynthesis/RimJ/RimL family protein N-acetyltransferase